MTGAPRLGNPSSLHKRRSTHSPLDDLRYMRKRLACTSGKETSIKTTLVDSRLASPHDLNFALLTAIESNSPIEIQEQSKNKNITNRLENVHQMVDYWTEF